MTTLTEMTALTLMTALTGRSALSTTSIKSPHRAEHIDPALKAAGWGGVAGSRILREYPISPCRIEGRGQRGIPEIADRNILANQAYNAFSAFQEDALVRIEPCEISRRMWLLMPGSSSRRCWMPCLRLQSDPADDPTGFTQQPHPALPVNGNWSEPHNLTNKLRPRTIQLRCEWTRGRLPALARGNGRCTAGLRAAVGSDPQPPGLGAVGGS